MVHFLTVVTTVIEETKHDYPLDDPRTYGRLGSHEHVTGLAFGTRFTCMAKISLASQFLNSVESKHGQSVQNL